MSTFFFLSTRLCVPESADWTMEALAAALQRHLAACRSLRRLALSVDRSEASPTALTGRLTDVWTAAHPSDAVVRRPTGRQLILTVSAL